jgi:hypothetical protein
MTLHLLKKILITLILISSFGCAMKGDVQTIPVFQDSYCALSPDDGLLACCKGDTLWVDGSHTGNWEIVAGYTCDYKSWKARA